jgi:hypothetical protein
MNQRWCARLVLSAMLVAMLAAGGASAAPPAEGGAAAAAGPRVGDEVKNFALLDYQGRHYELRRAGGPLVVLFFTGAQCPIARQTAHKLQAVAEEFGRKGVLVWMVNATPQNDPTDAKLDMMFKFGQYAPKEILGDRYAIQQLRDLVPPSILGDRATIRQETLQFAFGVPPLPPVLRDEHQLVSRYFGVTRTCDAVVIDTKGSTVVYRGAVDDQHVEGARKPRASHHFLRDAITEFLAGKRVTHATSKVHGCAITYMTDDEGADNGPVSYARTVAPLLASKCVGCHSEGNVGPFAMSSHEKVKGWSAMIEEVILDRRMPPWHADPHVGDFGNDRSLTGPEARAILKWIAQGCPRGDGDDPLAAAAARPPAAKWPLGAPDFVVAIPEQAVPATGTVDYRYIDADFVAPRDLWVRAATTRPGNPKVVHHVIVRLRQPSGAKTPPVDSFLFTTWVPGLDTGECPPGTGMFVPRGAKFNFEVHYTTTGEAQTDLTEVGLYLAKDTPRTRLDVRAAHTRALDVAPGDSDARHTATYFFRRDAVVYALAPHMHVRGKWFKFELLHPDGRREPLLSVPNYDFNWQTSYQPARPLRVPAGSWMLCTGAFDNSPANPHNPDPGVRVEWGPQTNNEMFMGFITLAEFPEESGRGAAEKSGRGGDQGRPSVTP